ncbi:MAG TPA: DUF4926 domain-containing protein [Phycisphaerales bacterium]|nr:DUF4926 domain-containing protein [Phycisphaerales bacterium]
MSADQSFKELQRVVLTTDLPQHGLAAGDVGTIVDVYAGGQGYEVEFVTLTGDTIGVCTVTAAQVRAVEDSDVTHARRLAG